MPEGVQGMHAQAFAQPQALAAQGVAEFERAGGIMTVFVGVVARAVFSGRGFRAGGARPRLSRPGDLRLFRPCFLCPARHLSTPFRAFFLRARNIERFCV
jgi:hypothetical protein